MCAYIGGHGTTGAQVEYLHEDDSPLVYLRPAKNEKSGQSRGRSHGGSDHVIFA